MQKLLSLPPNLVGCFHDITGYPKDEWFCTHDPIGHKLGSGGGSVHLLMEYWKAHGKKADERLLLLHAGGQSRRLPAYAPSGKILTPIPVFRWERGQRLSQNLLQLQLPLYERIMDSAPKSLRTMIVSGDVYIRATQPLQPIPEADVVCYGLWLGPEIAKDHGVFVSTRKDPTALECMLQKPSVDTLNRLQKDHFYLTDIGVWLLSDKAIEVLTHHSTHNGKVTEYDLYGTFGCGLGTHPSQHDDEVAQLKVAILPLPGGEFYHFGTSHELLSSTVAIQNLVNDQRHILHHSMKPCPSIFVQNTITLRPFTDSNKNVWVENSHVGARWELSHNNIVTGAPENDWAVSLKPNECIDFVPIGEEAWCVRRYGFYDKFSGDEQTTPRFPLLPNAAALNTYMNGDNTVVGGWLSAEQISTQANLHRLCLQRQQFRAKNWQTLAKNHEHSVFYQLDLDDAAREFRQYHIPAPTPIGNNEPLMRRISDAMFQSAIATNDALKATMERKAFALLREGLTDTLANSRVAPHKVAYDDQIVWGRSPVRIDIAGGWTDTPPYCLMEGGNVINLAIELNGQQPIQTYVKPCKEPRIVLRSIDLGASEVVTTYEQLGAFNQVGSPFSIPKAALALCGFLPEFCAGGLLPGLFLHGPSRRPVHPAFLVQGGRGDGACALCVGRVGLCARPVHGNVHGLSPRLFRHDVRLVVPRNQLQPLCLCHGFRVDGHAPPQFRASVQSRWRAHGRHGGPYLRFGQLGPLRWRHAAPASYGRSLAVRCHQGPRPRHPGAALSLYRPGHLSGVGRRSAHPHAQHRRHLRS